MDGRTLDHLARTLAGASPRRRLLALAGATLGAPIFGRADEAAAACKKVGQNCDENGDCCKGAKCKNRKCRCRNGWKDCNDDGTCNRPADDEQHCGACGNACGLGKTCCDGKCTDLDIDEGNCGSCGRRCNAEQICAQGFCRTIMPI